MNEMMKCVEMLRELLRDQIQRNADLHLLLSQQIEDVNEARRERDAAWEELARVRKELVSANRVAETNAKVNQGLCARLTEAERERDEARRELLEIISCIEQAVDFHQVHHQSFQASAVRNLLENINRTRKRNE